MQLKLGEAKLVSVANVLLTRDIIYYLKPCQLNTGAIRKVMIDAENQWHFGKLLPKVTWKEDNKESLVLMHKIRKQLPLCLIYKILRER